MIFDYQLARGIYKTGMIIDPLPKNAVVHFSASTRATRRGEQFEYWVDMSYSVAENGTKRKWQYSSIVVVYTFGPGGGQVKPEELYVIVHLAFMELRKVVLTQFHDQDCGVRIEIPEIDALIGRFRSDAEWINNKKAK